MNNLHHAINLYRNNPKREEKIRALKIEYALAETKEEKSVIAITLYNMGISVKANV